MKLYGTILFLQNDSQVLHVPWGRRMKQDTIVIFDFGGQYCHLIARRVRENNVYSEIVPNDCSVEELERLRKRFAVKGIILSGGPASIYGKGSPQMDRRILRMGIPILGICYGHQLIASYIGGDVKRAKKQEYGLSFARIRKPGALLKGLGKREQIWMSHGDTVYSLPRNLENLASTANCPIAAFQDRKNRIYGVQWHPEVIHTTNGNRILRNFIFDICHSKPNWRTGNMVGRYVSELKKTVGASKAIIAMSGGVDSSTAAFLASRALKRNLIAVYVDTGFMRANETEQIRRMAKKLKLNMVYVNAEGRFLRKLKGVTDPERKRKLIGREFIRIFEEVAKKHRVEYLIQGTIYPDRIESGQTRKSEVIKTHHNVGGLPTKIKFKGLAEPLKELYKDEVKKLAERLGLPDEIRNRQPFPGPGLAIRIVGDVTREKLDVLRKADLIVREEIDSSDIKGRLWQYFAVLTDTKSTGVKGDSRAYGDVVAVRMVESKEAMTASFADVPREILERISTRITNEIPQVVRVVYDITNKPPSTIEWE